MEKLRSVKGNLSMGQISKRQQLNVSLQTLLSLYKEGNFLEALAGVDKLIVAYPNFPELFNLKGRILLSLNKFEDSLIFYVKCLDQKEMRLDALLNLGVIYKKLAKFDKSIKSYIDALKIDPNNVGALNNLGNLFNEKGDYNYEK